jgi:hypothetical protein
MIGYAFSQEQRQKWVYNEMFAPDESTLDNYPSFYSSMEAFAPAFNEYTLMRFLEHPVRWDSYITKEPTVLSVAEVLFFF